MSRRVAFTLDQKREYKIKWLIEWIYGRMHGLNLTQEDVARKLNISQAALSTRLNPKTYEKNKRSDPFGYGDLLILCEVLEATPAEKEELLTL